MTLFGITEAQHYCQTFTGLGGLAVGSLDDYIAAELGTSKTLKEGTSTFNDYRDCSLRDAERCLFMAASQYRRATDLMTPAACWWAHVTLYYGTFFAASALLAMFGGRVLPRKGIVEVKSSIPGTQELVVNRSATSTYTTSHQRFWDFFYGATKALIPWVDTPLRLGITPVSSSDIWQAKNRRDINYDSYKALELSAQFQTDFDSGTFPGSLPGVLNTQFVIFEALLELTFGYAREFALGTDALGSLTPAGTRRAKLARLVFRDRASGLARKLKRAKILI